MPDKPHRLSKMELNKIFLAGLGDMVVWFNDVSSVPLCLDLMAPSGFCLKIRAYLYNLTNPPGGRAADEYKAQIILPGQRKGQTANLDYSEGRFVILAAYAQEGEEGVFVLWDADKHENIAFSSNVQVKSDAIIEATYRKVVRFERTNREIIVAARPRYLYDAIRCRIDIMKMESIGGSD